MLAARYYELYLVLKRNGTIAFKLQLLEQAKVHPVFHASQFKKVIVCPVEKELLTQLQDTIDNYQLLHILGTRTVNHSRSETSR